MHVINRGDIINPDMKNNTSFNIESIKQLSPEKRSDMIRIAIKRILKEHPEGVTSPDLSEITGLSIKTIRKHLEFLTAVREAYKKEYGARLTVFFPNGRLIHPYSDAVRKIGDSIFSFQRIDNTWGNFIYVQERKKDLHTNKTKTVGGILIERNSIEKFIEALKEEEEAWNIEEGNNKFKIGR